MPAKTALGLVGSERGVGRVQEMHRERSPLHLIMARLHPTDHSVAEDASALTLNENADVAP